MLRSVHIFPPFTQVFYMNIHVKGRLMPKKERLSTREVSYLFFLLYRKETYEEHGFIRTLSCKIETQFKPTEVRMRNLSFI